MPTYRSAPAEIRFYATDELHDTIARRAKARGSKISDYVRLAVTEFVRAEEEREAALALAKRQARRGGIRSDEGLPRLPELVAEAPGGGYEPRGRSARPPATPAAPPAAPEPSAEEDWLTGLGRFFGATGG